jgi:hypothetical protein
MKASLCPLSLAAISWMTGLKMVEQARFEAMVLQARRNYLEITLSGFVHSLFVATTATDFSFMLG